MKRRSFYILIQTILMVIFIWLILNLIREYHIKVTSIKEREEFIGYHTSDDVMNKDIPWQFLASPFFILFTYYLIPYLIFILAYLKNKHRMINTKIMKHRKIYLNFFFIFLFMFSYLFYHMIINIAALFELFEYVNIFFLWPFVYLVLYLTAYDLGKHLGYAINILMNYENKS